MEKLVAAINSVDQVEDALKGFLIALSAGNEKSTALKRMAVANGIVQCLTNLLKRSWGYLEAEKLTVNSVGDDLGKDSNGRQGKETVTTVLALSCIYHICDGSHFSHYQKFVDKDFVSTLLGYIIPDPALMTPPYITNHFFQFGSAYEATVKAAISSSNNEGYVFVCFEEDKNSVGSPKKASSNSQSSGASQTGNAKQTELKFYEPVYYETVINKPVEIKPCQVLFSTETKSADLAEYLVSAGVAWPHKDQMIFNRERSKTNKLSQSLDSADISKKAIAAKVTCILRGNYFWVVIGEEKMSQMQQIARGMSHLKAKLANVRPKKLDVVAAKVKTALEERLLRARVIREEEKMFQVLDVDSGCMHRVSACDVYNLPSIFNLMKYPPLATLACLQGVYPTPLDVRAPELALGSLARIIRNDSIITVTNLLQSGIMNVLPGFVNCPDLEVAYRALDLVANLTSYRINAVRSVPWFNLIPAILATLQVCMQRTAENRKMLYSKKLTSTPNSKESTPPRSSDESLSSSDSSECDRSMSYPPVSVICEDNLRTNAIVESCIACLANCMFMSVKGKSAFYQNHGLDKVIQAFSLYYNNEIIRLLCLKTLANYVYFNTTSNPCLKRFRYRGLKTQRNVTGNCADDNSSSDVKTTSRTTDAGTDSDEDSGNEEEEELSSLDVSPQSFANVDMHRSSSFTSEDSEDGSCLPSRYYIRGDKMPFTHDATHELQLTSRPSKSDFAAVICGFLNTGRIGTIYLGLNPKDSSVVGVELDHDARDELRMGVDHLLVESLTPGVLHLQFHLEFVPVVDMPTKPNGSDKGATASDDEATLPVFRLGHDYIVEIEVRPLPNVIYCCSGNECFYRLDGKTVVLDCQLIRQLLILEEEADCVEQIVQLRQELQTLQAEADQLQSLS
ncbi:hypothetical protein ElyMa_002231400 [Elysia marginata]|uniref:Tudor domain-containing protein n=1 Tax=Elysia marginata TaxID=1093978 RepID=A0AAV4FWW9_9GAST|nr:hypothetical protein ElyMa_002231400 [Elysia marginata]